MATTAVVTPDGVSRAPWRRLDMALIYPFVAIAGLLIYFSARSQNFLTIDNIENIGRQSSVLMLVALAGTVVILIGSIDLSVAAIVALAGIACAKLVDPLGTLPAILAAIGFGGLVGFVNGALIIGLRIPSFLATLGTLSVLAGVANHIADGAPVLFASRGLPDLANGSILGVPNVVLLAAATVAGLTGVVFRTRFGRYLFAIGGGEPVAAISGVPISRYKVAAFVLAGLLCGAAGVVVTGQVSAGTPDVGSDLLLDSIAAVVMGGTALSGGVGGPHRTVLGVLVIAILSNGMDVTGIQEFTQSIVKGAVIVAAVALSIDRKKYPFIR